MKIGRLLLVALVLLAGAMVLAGGRVEAFPGDGCRHTAECSAHELCVADGEHSTTGRCQRLRVLP